MQTQIFKVEQDQVGSRLDNFLLLKLSDKTRSYIKNLIQKGQVLVNDNQLKAGYSLRLNDNVCVSIEDPIPTDINPENIPLDIVYQDDDLAVINKPQGMVVHPSSGCYSGTLVNALMYHMKDLSGINGEIRPGIVHRLDKDTSGLIVIAKNDTSHVNLAEQIQQKTCKRIYQAIVYGVVKQDEGVIETYLNRGHSERKKIFVVRKGEGKLAITHYRVLKRFKGFTLVEYELKTGRTHQIRVHSSYIGHPVVGDPVYCKVEDKFGLKGQLLHAINLSFTHPKTNKFMSFSASLPEYFKNFLNKLEN